MKTLEKINSHPSNADIQQLATSIVSSRSDGVCSKVPMVRQ